MDPLLAKIVFVFGFVVVNFVIRASHIKAYKRLPIRSNRNTRLDTSLFIAVGVFGFFLPLLYVFTPLFSFADYSISRWIGVTGVVVLVLGNWVFWKSHKDLGGNWSPTLDIRQDHKLVTGGIYQRIRHHMYSIALVAGHCAGDDSAELRRGLRRPPPVWDSLFPARGQRREDDD